jgi:CHAT domain-containing protein/tetratricopeptide (TPR) repeat protein
VTGEAQTTGKPSPCPDPGLIAAHADRRLSGAEAAHMDAHIAGCLDCYEVFSETVQFGLADGGAERRPKGVLLTFAKRPAFRIAAGFAAAAAALFVVFTTFVTTRKSTPGTVPLVTELAQAIGERRFIEPRLTGFNYGRLIVLRSGDTQRGLDAQPPAVLAAVAKIRERAENDPSPEALGALGITYLISGDVAAAVKALESASEQDPKNARLLCDLSAAYLARGRQTDEPADIPKALESAEKSIALPNPPVEAWFNRALALEALHLTDAARKAWDDYLSRDSSSDWSGEARQHLERLPAKRQSSAEEDNARVRAALDQGAPAVERLADEDPRLLRDYLEGELLPAWADAYLADADANLHSEHARLLGDALFRTTADAMPRDAARALAEPVATGARDPLRSQALGYRALREGKRLYDLHEPSCSTFRQALRDLEVADSPYAAWAKVESVYACLYPSEPVAAMADLDELTSLAEPHGYLQLLGRVRWIQGLIHLTRGELTASLERFHSARALFQTCRNTEREAAILALLAENLQLLGETPSAWRHRQLAFERLDEVRHPRPRQLMLTDAIFSCLDERLSRSALHYGTALVETAKRSSIAVDISEALQRRAAIHYVLGHDDRAATDLREARLWIARVSVKASAERLDAEADAVEGELLLKRQSEAAARSLARSLAYFEVAAPVRAPALHLLLARAHTVSGLHTAAEKELLSGIQTMERERTLVRDTALQVSFFDQAYPLFDDMVRLQVTKRSDPERALAFVERGHARQLVDSLAGAAVAPLEPEALMQKLPDGLTLVYYLPLEDGLFAWTLSREGLHFIERPLSAAELSRLVAAHRTAIERRAPVGVVRRTAARLYDELVHPLIPFLRSQRALVFIPNGVLQSAAFAALWNPASGRYLVEEYLLGFAPSGTVFVGATSALDPPLSGAHRALVIGNPRPDRRLWASFPNLPEAEDEAVEIAGLYEGSELLIGTAATKQAFVEGVQGSQVVHYAGHAAASANAPSSSRLLLAADPHTGDSGALYLHELERSRLPRTLVVVLAACRTAAGSASRVEGPLSLGRPFLAAGVPDVVASLWDVDDAISRRFFVGFHRMLLDTGNPILALRKTQVALLLSDDATLAHPASWAAFICMGGLPPHSLSKGEAS